MKTAVREVCFTGGGARKKYDRRHATRVFCPLPGRLSAVSRTPLPGLADAPPRSRECLGEDAFPGRGRLPRSRGVNKPVLRAWERNSLLSPHYSLPHSPLPTIRTARFSMKTAVAEVFFTGVLIRAWERNSLLPPPLLPPPPTYYQDSQILDENRR